MEKIERMHEVYGKGPEKAICWDCHFCHWKVDGTGEDRHVAYRWCEAYGLNKEDVTETDWKWEYPACGYYNIAKDPPVKNIYKRKQSGIEQMTLF